MAVKDNSKNVFKAVLTITGVIVLVLVGALVINSLLTTDVFTSITKSGSVVNETGGYINATGYSLAQKGTLDFSLSTITIVNGSGGFTIAAGNYTVTSGVVTNKTVTVWPEVVISYTYTYTDGDTVAGVNVSQVGNAFAAFVTALIGFFAVVGVILAIVWLIGYIYPLFSKKEGIQSFAGN